MREPTLLFVLVLQLAIAPDALRPGCPLLCSVAIDSILTAPQSDEPLYDPFIHQELWYEDFSSYSALSDLAAGNGARSWRVVVGNYPGAPWSEWELMLGAGRNGGNLLRAHYRPHPEGRQEWSPGEANPADRLDAGRNPDVIMLTQWVRNVGDLHKGKAGLKKGSPTFGEGCRTLVLTVSAKPRPQEMIETYWKPDWPYEALDPLRTPPRNHPAFMLTRDGCRHQGELTWSYKQNINFDKVDNELLLNDGQWHRWTLRLTKAPSDGQGRIEFWFDGVKVIEYLGDDPWRPEFGLVYLPQVGSGTPLLPAWYWWGPMKSDWIANELWLDLDEARVYTQKMAKEGV